MINPFWLILLQSFDKGISPQASEISRFASKYIFDCDRNSILIVPLSFLMNPSENVSVIKSSSSEKGSECEKYAMSSFNSSNFKQAMIKFDSFNLDLKTGELHSSIIVQINHRLIPVFQNSVLIYFLLLRITFFHF